MPLPTLALCLETPLGLRGGVSVVVEELIRGLAGHFRLLLVSPDEPEEWQDHPVASLIAAHHRWDPHRITAARSRAVAEWLREQRCDVAHFHIGGVYGWGIRVPGRSPFGFTARADIAVCSTVHLTVALLDGYCGPKKPIWFKLALLPFAWLGKLDALRHTRAEIAVSHYDEAQLKRWFAPLAGRFRQVYHSRLSSASDSPPAERAMTILCVGHIARRKGQHLLVEAFARVAPRHPAWRLEIVGPLDDAEGAELVRGAIERSGVKDRINLAGSRDEVRSLMCSAGLYVQPSLEEALGLALQEALFEGCPAIGSTAGGIPELIRDGDNGLVVPKGDVDALASALDRLMSDATLRTKFGERARPSIVERGMTLERMIHQHLALYHELLDRR